MQYELIALGKSEKSELLGKWHKDNLEEKSRQSVLCDIGIHWFLRSQARDFSRI